LTDFLWNNKNNIKSKWKINGDASKVNDSKVIHIQNDSNRDCKGPANFVHHFLKKIIT